MQIPASLALRQQEAFMDLPGIALQLYASLALAVARGFHEPAWHYLPRSLLQALPRGRRSFHKPAWHCHAVVCKPCLAAEEVFINLPGIVMQLPASLASRQKKFS
jgi:hypothetical protein